MVRSTFSSGNILYSRILEYVLEENMIPWLGALLVVAIYCTVGSDDYFYSSAHNSATTVKVVRIQRVHF